MTLPGVSPEEAGTAAGRRFEVIPALDLRGGRCVRLTRGDYGAETVYAGDPVAVASRWVAEGARRLHVVDLDGAREGRPVHLDVLRAVAALGVPVQFGGGLRAVGDVERCLAAGARWAIVGTRALADPGFLAETRRLFGQAILVSLDLRAGRAAVAGWLEEGLPAEEAARLLHEAGQRDLIVTDVGRDGTLGGVDEGLFAGMARRGFAVIAAGGVGSLADVEALADLARRLRAEGAPGRLAGVVVGKALYEGRVSLSEALARTMG